MVEVVGIGELFDGQAVEVLAVVGEATGEE